ncbi:MAG: UvrD-helicase domain-containing protein [bacterium]|nr:UvrD-helicase domain-containing protein [bacterium]MDY4099984.1 UvrD-helicase domain-containing protein [Lachnospiraceae bacterium]
MTDILQGLNEKQKEAVTTTEGYIRVVAGAGSGKTKALTHRYAFLVDMLGVATDNILCVTFTNKAAGEMKSRIRTLIGDHDTGYICTFHGFCVRELREDIHLMHYPKNFTIIDDQDQNTIFHTVYEDRSIDPRRYPYSLARDVVSAQKELLQYIPLINQTDNEKLSRLYESARKPEEIIFYGYLLEQKKNYALDYDDLINFTYHILTTYQDVCSHWQKKLQYIMVDEFQDVSHRQYQLANILSGYHKNLFIVGDPDQTIYSWRGADVKIFLQFPMTHPDTKTIIMDNNYRSNAPIIMGSNSMIEKNSQRIEKKLVPVKTGGSEIVYFHGKNVQEESGWIADTIGALLKRGYNYEDIAVLYRAHHVSRPVEETFLKAKIPYVIYSGVEFYGRKEIKDVLSYLKMLLNQDDVSFLRTVNEPRRNFGKKRLELIRAYAKAHDCSLYESLKANMDQELIQKSKANEYVSLIETYKETYQELRITELLERILAETGYEAGLKSAGEDERLENLAELKQSIYDYEKTANESTSLEEYLQNIALFTNMDKEQRKKSVKLMTIHASKGLEFPIVFVCGLSEGIFPNSRITGYDDMEEERRLAYVAFTRAEDQLFLSDAEGYTFQGESRCPSRFVFNVDERYLKYIVPIEPERKELFLKRIEGSEHFMQEEKEPTIRTGTRIRHPYLGEGTVQLVDHEHKCYEILFDKIGTPRSIMMTMELEIIDIHKGE